MRFRFISKRLQTLYTTDKGASGYAPGVIDAFFEVMTIIAAAPDERDLRALKSLHFEKLRGKRQGQHSVRLNKQFRLTFEIKEEQRRKIIIIHAIEDYH
jgi:proteic killer suppression protein